MCIPPSSRRFRRANTLRALIPFVGFQLCAAGGALAQARGKFVIPEIRGAGGTRFSNWDYFTLPTGTTRTYGYQHEPNLLGTGDVNGNPSNYNAGARLVQTGTPTAFITSTNAIYSFMEPTAFEVRYTNIGTDPVTNVIFQTQAAGSTLDLSQVKLRFTTAGGETQVISPKFKALDDPGTGGFAERLVSAFQWDLTGLGVTDYTIAFSTGTSFALYQAQLDTVAGGDFIQQLGYLVRTGARPFPPQGVTGYVERTADTEEDRFYLPGTVVTLEPEPEAGFSHVGWIDNGTVIDSAESLEVTMADADQAVYGIFSPVSWEDYRYAFFFHANALFGVGDDFKDDAVSAPEVDHDKDGLTNLLEYAFGGDPYTRDAKTVAPEPTVVLVEGVAYPALTFRKQAALETDLTFAVEESADLSTWASGGANPPVETASTLLTSGVRRVTVRSATPLGAGPRFMRLRVERSEP